MKRFFTRAALLYAVVFIGAVVLTAGVAALLINISERQREGEQYPLRLVEIGEDELDPEVWGRNFPIHYDRFMMTRVDYGETPYGGSNPYSKLDRYPAMVRLWAGYAFSKGHNEERGHYYAQIDQRDTVRVQVVAQPGACANCHAAEAPQLISSMGWENFNRTPYLDLVDELHYGSSCADCHDPQTMELRITRPALVQGLALQGVDVTQATRQEMRTYVCAQCHVEYYFLGENRELTFPWSQGFTVDNIEAHYDEYGFTDWTHEETGAPMIKMQHPEFEMWSTGLHARSGVSCADCHMPYIREGGIKVSDHWVRSPLVNLNNACQTCHNIPEAELVERILTIQTTTSGLLRDTEEALLEAIDAIVEVRELGATDDDLAEAWQFHRAASLRWDFVSSENSTGFHSPQESARILADAINNARQAQLSAMRLRSRLAASEVAVVPTTDATEADAEATDEADGDS